MPSPGVISMACIHHKTSTLCPKNIPDISDCNFKTNYQILIIFDTNIPDNLPPNNYSVAHLTQRLFLHYLEKLDQAKYVLK